MSILTKSYPLYSGTEKLMFRLAQRMPGEKTKSLRSVLAIVNGNTAHDEIH